MIYSRRMWMLANMSVRLFVTTMNVGAQVIGTNARRAFSAFIAMAGLLVSAQALALPILFSNYGPGIGFDPLVGITVAGANFAGGGTDSANFFDTPVGAPVVLDAVEIPVTLIKGPNELIVALMSNAAGSRPDQQAGVPGSIIESWELSGAVPFSAAPIDVASTGHTLLQPDTRYWLALFAGHPDSLISWSTPSATDIFRASQRARLKRRFGVAQRVRSCGVSNFRCPHSRAQHCRITCNWVGRPCYPRRGEVWQNSSSPTHRRIFSVVAGIVEPIQYLSPAYLSSWRFL